MQDDNAGNSWREAWSRETATPAEDERPADASEDRPPPAGDETGWAPGTFRGATSRGLAPEWPIPFDESAAGHEREVEREQWLREYIDREQRFRLYFAQYIAGLLGKPSRAMRLWRWLIDDFRSERREQAGYLEGIDDEGLIPRLRARRRRH